MQWSVFAFLSHMLGSWPNFSVPSRLVSWISQSTYKLELLTNKGSVDRKLPETIRVLGKPNALVRL
jgi:hypothetical protein